jgi:aspartyl-tRNA(Asn)/glutamyl-tRNA(Gln) amidotransferase subunit C
MSEFDSKTLKYLESLCRIECTPEEEAVLVHSLTRVLEYIHLLDQLDTKDTPPCHFVLKTMKQTQLREDRVESLMSREQFLNNAPDHIGGFIRVPPVLKAP